MRLNDVLFASSKLEANSVTASCGVLDCVYNSLGRIQLCRQEVIIVGRAESLSPQGKELANNISGMVVAYCDGSSV